MTRQERRDALHLKTKQEEAPRIIHSPPFLPSQGLYPHMKCRSVLSPCLCLPSWNVEQHLLCGVNVFFNSKLLERLPEASYMTSFQECLICIWYSRVFFKLTSSEENNDHINVALFLLWDQKNIFPKSCPKQVIDNIGK